MNNDRIYYSHTAETHASRAMFRLTVVCLIAGLGIGVVLTLLLAPISGKKTREGLSKMIEDGLQNGREAVEPMVKQLEKDFDELQKSVEERIKA